MKKEEKIKFDNKLKDSVTPFDSVIKETVTEIQDTKQMLVHSKYNVDYLDERVKRLNIMLKDYKQKSKEFKK